MRHVNGLRVTLARVADNEVFPESEIPYIIPVDDDLRREGINRLVEADAGTLFYFDIQVPRDFDFMDADGLKIVVAIGHKFRVDHSMADLQVWYAGKENIVGRMLRLSCFYNWDRKGERLPDEPFGIPQRDVTLSSGDTTYHLRDKINANKNAITVFVDRVKDENSCEADVTGKTVPPPQQRFSEVNGPHIINWTWVTPVEDTAPYIFEFMNAARPVLGPERNERPMRGASKRRLDEEAPEVRPKGIRRTLRQTQPRSYNDQLDFGGLEGSPEQEDNAGDAERHRKRRRRNQPVQPPNYIQRNFPGGDDEQMEDNILTCRTDRITPPKTPAHGQTASVAEENHSHRSPSVLPVKAPAKRVPEVIDLLAPENEDMKPAKLRPFEGHTAESSSEREMTDAGLVYEIQKMKAEKKLAELMLEKERRSKGRR